MTATRDWEAIAALVARACRGDDEAFRELMELHRRSIAATLAACGIRCEATARDLTQEVMLKAWRSIRQIREPRAFPNWLRRTAANAARDHLRRSAVRGEIELDEALNVELEVGPHEQAERVVELRLMLAALAEEDRETIRLLVMRGEGVPVNDLARDAGLTEGALKMRLSRARQRLRQRLLRLRTGG